MWCILILVSLASIFTFIRWLHSINQFSNKVPKWKIPWNAPKDHSLMVRNHWIVCISRRCTKLFVCMNIENSVVFRYEQTIFRKNYPNSRFLIQFFGMLFHVIFILITRESFACGILCELQLNQRHWFKCLFQGSKIKININWTILIMTKFLFQVQRLVNSNHIFKWMLIHLTCSHRYEGNGWFDLETAT